MKNKTGVCGSRFSGVFFLILSLPVCGQIVNTLTSANLTIRTNGTPPVILATDTKTDPYFARVDVSYLPWEASAFSWFKTTLLDIESAQVDFSVGMAASDGSGYMGEDTLGQNHVFFIIMQTPTPKCNFLMCWIIRIVLPWSLGHFILLFVKDMSMTVLLSICHGS